MNEIKNKLFIAAGLMMLVVGSLLFITPLPGGIVLISLGLFLLIKESRIAQGIVYGLRRQHKTLNKMFRYVEKRAPRYFSRIIMKTRPRKFFTRRRKAATV